MHRKLSKTYDSAIDKTPSTTVSKNQIFTIVSIQITSLECSKRNILVIYELNLQYFRGKHFLL